MVADSWIENNQSQISDAPPEYHDWWSVFQDPKLIELVETAYQQNLTLRAAGLRVLEAQWKRAIVTGDLFPQVQQINGSFSRSQIGTLSQPRVTPLPEFQRSFNAWSLSSNLS